MLRDGKRKVGTPTENDNTDRKSQVENLAGRKMVGPGGLEPLTSSVSNPPPTAGICGINRLGRTSFGSHWHFLVWLGVLCATICATLFLFQDPAYAQVRYDTFFLKPLPAGGVTSVSGLATVCPGAGLATTAASVTANVATLTMASNPLTAGFVNGRTIQVLNFTGTDTYFNGTFVLTNVSSTQLQYSLTHANNSASTTGGAIQTPTSASGCAPTTTVYSDQALTTAITQPFADDGRGNVGFFAAPGNYYVAYSASGLNPMPLNFVTLPCTGASGCTFTGATTAAKLNNVIRVDGVTYAFSTAGLQAAIAAAIAAGGGTVDARGMGNFNITSEIDVGSHAQIPITLLLPQAATWTVVGITNGSSCALKLFSQSAIMGLGTGGSSAMVIHGGAVTNNLDSLLCTESSPTGNGSYVRAENFQLYNPNNATLVNGALNVQAVFDDSDFRNITVANFGGIGAFVHGLVCCGAAFHGLTVNGNGVAGSKPLVVNLNTVTAEVAFYDTSADFPGTGQSAISVTAINNTRAVRFYNTYISGSQTDNTTADISVASTGGPVDFFGVTCNNSGTSTAHCLDIVSAANVSVHVYGLQQVVGGSSNCINDHFLSVTVPCDSQGNVAEYVLGASNFQQVRLANKLLIAQANPTITSGFNAGTIGASCNGPSSCNVNVGVGTAGSTGVIGLPTSTAGWNCWASNQTRADLVLQTANTTTSATLTNFGTTFAATNWTNSDNIIFSCFAR